jgi:glycosyltransferase involved in cell wall biosynthesis
MDAQIMKPRVLVLTKLFWPEGSGGELATYLIVKNILSRHFHVFVVSGTRKPEADILRLAEYIHWSVLETKYKPIEWLKLFANTYWLRRLIEEADIVYIPSHTLIPVAIVAKHLKPNVKVILHLHNYQVLTFTSVVLAGRRPDLATDIIVEYGEHKSLARALIAEIGHHVNYVNRCALKYVDRVICVSRRQREIIEEAIPEVKGRITVIYNPLPDLPFTEKRLTDEKLLLYLGGSSFVKGFHVLLKALDEVTRRHNDLRVFMTKVKGAKGLARTYMVCEELPYEEVVKLHARAYALLFPSLWEEPLPYTVVESMLMGTMPVAARVGGVPEIVRGSPAEEYLFTPGDAEEFADKIESVLAMSDKQIADIGFALRETALKKFNHEVVKRKLIKVFSLC